MSYKPLKILLLLIGMMTAAFGVSPTRAQTPDCGATPCKFVPLPEPKHVALDLTTIAKIDLKSLPVVPDISNNIQTVYTEGLRRGNNPGVFSKVGDCMTATPDFLEPIGKKDYALDKYQSLQKVIDYFSKTTVQANLDSFGNPGLASFGGFNAASVLDATWADPKSCKGSESPLTCEYRNAKPAVALIMFGTNDLKEVLPDDFDFFLRRVVVQTYNAGIIPVLSTFPTQPGLEQKSILYNQITAQIAADYHLPLINLWLALEPLPNKGIDPQVTTHMTKPQNGHSASFTADDLKVGGYNMRNLITLQTLEAVLKVVDPDGLKK